jgi:hypothetical protein
MAEGEAKGPHHPGDAIVQHAIAVVGVPVPYARGHAHAATAEGGQGGAKTLAGRLGVP